MAFELPPNFIDQVWQIRGTSIISEDYDCLLKDKHKVQSTIMNAFKFGLSSWRGPQHHRFAKELRALSKSRYPVVE
jgi:hypothetical protein